VTTGGKRKAAPAEGKARWHQAEAGKVLEQLGTAWVEGLSEAEAGRRLLQYGPNELVAAGMKSPWRILWEQLTALLVVILIFAAVVSALLGDFKDAIAIGAIMVLNAALGFSQEYRAEKAMAALKKMAAPSVRVRRAREVRAIPAARLVPGDIVLLEAGNIVAADGRILESAGLQVQEAPLTGESEAVRKTQAAIGEMELPVGDRRNMVYLGTFVNAGRGQAVVTETGMRTELGRIATLIQTVGREATPLQRRLAHLGKGLAGAALVLVAVIFALGLMRGEEIKLLFLTSVSIGVAAVPEGLPALVTIALTLGAHRMLKRNVLIRKLPAVETLGSVTVICSDKTGTLTENRMTAALAVLTDGSRLDLLAAGRSGAGAAAAGAGFNLLLSGMALCNDAVMPAGGAAPLGDPTEVALAEAADHLGLKKVDLDALLPRVDEVPFNSERKRMTTVHRLPAEAPSWPTGLRPVVEFLGTERVAFTKGAVDSLLQVSGRVWANGRVEPLEDKWRNRLQGLNDSIAKQGMRVLALAFRPAEVRELGAGEAIERGLIFLGMAGVIDPPRAEAAQAVAKCKSAGIRPVMITGDHPLTAQYIAASVGMTGQAAVLTGVELDRMTVGELEDKVEATPVYARVSPEHKLKIVEALQRRGQIVAMTGDGVNDAPALKRAEIGVAMGITGTDVAKEAADMVLLDDNFSTIVAAVEQGRVIYDNLRKFIKYILATNSGEIAVMLAAPLFGMPLPLLPLQILWMNLVTDGLPALALGLEPAESDAMRRPPHPPGESIFHRGLGRHVVWVGLLMGILSLGTGYWFWRAGDPHWQTLLFTTLTLSQMAHVMAIRSEHDSLFKIGLWSNRALLGAVVLTTLLQIALVYAPGLQQFFATRALPAGQLALALGLSLVIFAAVELEKWIGRRSGRRSRA
jgi:Ca2+-transporting ATPase